MKTEQEAGSKSPMESGKKIILWILVVLAICVCGYFLLVPDTRYALICLIIFLGIVFSRGEGGGGC